MNKPRTLADLLNAPARVGPDRAMAALVPSGTPKPRLRLRVKQRIDEGDERPDSSLIWWLETHDGRELTDSFWFNLPPHAWRTARERLADRQPPR